MNKHRLASVAWAAGLFEGEGCIHCRYETDGRDGKKYLRFKLGLEMVDEDVVRRFADIVGGRPVKEKSKKTVTGKTVWSWYTSGIDDTERLLKLFLPFFGERRGRKAVSTLMEIDAHRMRRARKNA